MSDGGHYILDCAFDPIASPESLAGELDHVVGLVEHGLFIGMTFRGSYGRRGRGASLDAY